MIVTWKNLRIDFFKCLVVVSVVAVLAVPLYTVVSLLPSVKNIIIDTVEVDARHIATHLAFMFVDSDKPLSEQIVHPQLDVGIKMVQKDFGLQKVKIYSAAGKVIYSTNPLDIGAMNTSPYFSEVVASGNLHSTIVRKDHKSMEGDRYHADLVETYVPIMRNGEFLGAFEVYYDISEPFRNFHGFVLKFYLTFFPVVLILLGAIIYSAVRVTRSMAERNRAEEKIKKQSADLQKMNTELSVLYELSKKRQEEVVSAQQEKLEAYEKVQEEMARSKQLRQELLRHIVKAQEDERARISRELHDETAQVLTAASLNMEALKKYVSEVPEAEELIARSKDLCRKMSQGLYRLVHDLRPAQLDDLGLVPALEHLVEEGGCCDVLVTTMKITGKQRRLDPFVETVLYRAAQEALTNVARHAQVGKASLQLHFNEGQVILRVRDKGVGFDPDTDTPAGKSGWGLEGMRERVESIHGQFFIQSSPGNGTLVEVIVPTENK